ncbi:zinc-ribbon domain-containing protein [Methanobrevibacter smithii]|uniref:zinc-ribbon domain-containing protein n=1 Tax=Methanobrevibacter smithii TaxID=2173 RepID=UPI0037DD6361
MTKCPVCGSESQNNEEICKNCGSKLPKKKTEKTVVEQKDTKFCPKCGAEISKTVNACPKCGAKSQSNVTQQEQKSPFIAGILSLIIFGIGQFYNGQPRKGALLFIGGYFISIILIYFFGYLTYIIIALFSAYDAYTTAEAINRGETPEDTFNLKEKLDGL